MKTSQPKKNLHLSSILHCFGTRTLGLVKKKKQRKREREKKRKNLASRISYDVIETEQETKNKG